METLASMALYTCNNDDRSVDDHKSIDDDSHSKADWMDTRRVFLEWSRQRVVNRNNTNDKHN